MNPINRFYSLVIRIAVILALAGQLKSCTLDMMNLAAQKTDRGIISYSQFSQLLTRGQ